MSNLDLMKQPTYMLKSIACLLLYEDYVWVSLGNAVKAKQSKAT
jgi:hypothetical protein